MGSASDSSEFGAAVNELLVEERISPQKAQIGPNTFVLLGLERKEEQRALEIAICPFFQAFDRT